MYVLYFFIQILNKISTTAHIKHMSIFNKKKKKFQSKTDPLGSYTGVPENPYEEPVQDADDL